MAQRTGPSSAAGSTVLRRAHLIRRKMWPRRCCVHHQSALVISQEGNMRIRKEVSRRCSLFCITAQRCRRKPARRVSPECRFGERRPVMMLADQEPPSKTGAIRPRSQARAAAHMALSPQKDPWLKTGLAAAAISPAARSIGAPRRPKSARPRSAVPSGPRTDTLFSRSRKRRSFVPMALPAKVPAPSSYAVRAATDRRT